MKKKIFSQGRYPNGAHSEFNHFVQELVEADKLVSEVVKDELESYVKANAMEDEAQGKVMASEYTIGIDAQDAIRGTMYKSFAKAVWNFQKCSQESYRNDARAIGGLLKKYKISTRSHRDKETGSMRNLIVDLQSEAYSAKVEHLGMTAVVSNMKNANDKLRELSKKRGDERCDKVKISNVKARNLVDDAFEDLMLQIMAKAKSKSTPEDVRNACADIADKVEGKISEYHSNFSSKKKSAAPAKDGEKTTVEDGEGSKGKKPKSKENKEGKTELTPTDDGKPSGVEPEKEPDGGEKDKEEMPSDNPSEHDAPQPSDGDNTPLNPAM
jgi:hypothetical protein